MNRFKTMALVAAMALAAVSCTPDCEEVRNAEALAARIMQQQASKVKFVKTESPDSLDFFELSSRGGKVVIAANNANAMATGLNYYLRNYCNTAVSWYDYNPVVLPATLPDVPEPVRVNSCVENRFFLNYCTFGYTLPFWKWEQWERFIDWMALNGVNLPLAITGQEAVWQKVWVKFGMTEEQVRAFFAGPVFLPWQRMVNIDRWEGPLPQNWIDSQAELQKLIVRRERELGMRPVLPAFAGHIPAEIKQLHPEINATPVGEWGGFGEEYQCTFLNSLDPMYEQIQRAFLEEQEAMYGTDHFYGIDLFNEVAPPSWDSDTLATISAHVYESLAAVDPEAKWVQMGWLFFNDRSHWTPERIKAYMGAVPQGKVILLDYFAERREIWRTTDCFGGQPFIWCNLGNFGGNMALDGNPVKVAGLIEAAKEETGPLMSGIGCTLEAFGVNEFMFEFVLGQAWRKDGGKTPLHSMAEWGESTADAHFGAVSEPFREAWKLMCTDIYRSNASARATLTNSVPCLHGYSQWCNDSIFYDNHTLRRVLELMLEEESGSEIYRYDIVNVARQYLGNCFALQRDRFSACHEAGDREGADREWGVMMEMMDDMDELLACRREFSLEDWLSLARNYGTTGEESDYYEKTARQIITTWGPGEALRDYANRALAGLMKSYYKVRWEMWRDRIGDPSFEKDMVKFMYDWSDRTLGFEKERRGDACANVRKILEKYDF